MAGKKQGRSLRVSQSVGVPKKRVLVAEVLPDESKVKDFEHELRQKINLLKSHRLHRQALGVLADLLQKELACDWPNKKDTTQ